MTPMLWQYGWLAHYPFTTNNIECRKKVPFFQATQFNKQKRHNIVCPQGWVCCSFWCGYWIMRKKNRTTKSAHNSRSAYKNARLRQKTEKSGTIPISSTTTGSKSRFDSLTWATPSAGFAMPALSAVVRKTYNLCRSRVVMIFFFMTSMWAIFRTIFHKGDQADVPVQAGDDDSLPLRECNETSITLKLLLWIMLNCYEGSLLLL